MYGKSIDNVKMYKYAKFYQNIPCGSRVISVFTKRAQLVKMMLAKPRHCFAWQWLNNVKVHKYTTFEENISWGSRVNEHFH